MKYLNSVILRLYSLVRLVWLKIRYGERFKSPYDVIINPYVRIMIDKTSCIQFGHRVHINRSVYLSAVNGGVVRFGNNTSFNQRCHFVCRESILINDNCIFGPGVVIYDHDHEFNSKEGVKQTFKTGSITIESGCWIAANVTILRNTLIGKKSVVGAGVVLQGNIPDGSLVTANRELVIKKIE